MYDSNARPHGNNARGWGVVTTASGKHFCSRFEHCTSVLSFRVVARRRVPTHVAADLLSPYPHQTSQRLAASSASLPLKVFAVGPSSRMGPRRVPYRHPLTAYGVPKVV